MTVGRTFDVQRAAVYLNVAPITIQRAAHEGRLKGKRDRLHSGGPWLFTKEELDTFRDAMVR